MSQKADLEACGYAVLTAASGEKAIETVRQKSEEIDLILMDIELGSGIDGIEAARQILEEYDIPIVFLSSHTEPELDEKTEIITSYGYVVKASCITVLDASIKMAFKLFYERQKVEASEGQFQELYNAMREGVAIYRAIEDGNDFEFVDLNLGGSISGNKIREEVIGCRPAEVFPEIEEAGLLDAFRNVHKTGVPQHHPLIHYKDGQVERWMENYIYSLPSGLLVSIYYDATERHRIDEALFESESRYRSLAENINDIIFLINTDRKFTFVSSAVERIVGYRPEEVLDKPFTDFVCKEDLPVLMKHYEQVMAGETKGSEYRIIKKNGNPIWVSCRSSPIYRQKKVVGLQGVMRDITDRKRNERARVQSEERFRALADLLPEGVFEFDLDMNLTYVNQKALELSGHTREDFEKGVNVMEMLIPEDQPLAMANIKRLFVREKTTTDQYSIVRKDGSSIPILVHTNPILVKDSIVGIRGIAVNISGQKEVEESLTRAYREKDNLLMELQHRAKNSFAMINGIISLIKQGTDDPGVESVLSELGSKVYAISEMYDLLYTSNSTTEVDLNLYLRRIIDGVPMVSGNIEKTCRFESIVIPVKIAIPIGLIATELVTNAIKHVFPENEKGKIQISLRKTDLGAELEIRDNGVGSTDTDNSSRNGLLGLNLVHALIGQIKGDLSIEEQGGTCCLLSFPLKKQPGI